MISQLAKTLHTSNTVFDFYNMSNRLRLFRNPLAINQLRKELLSRLPMITNNPNEYGYSKNLLSKNSLITSYIIAWNPYAKTNIHSHTKNGCYMMGILGKLQEDIYSYSDKQLIKTRFLLPGDEIKFIYNKMGSHSITNLNDETSISLHIYSPSIELSDTNINMDLFKEIDNLSLK